MAAIDEEIASKQQCTQDTQTLQIKEAASLKTQIEMMTEQLHESRQQLQQNSQNSQVQQLANNIFKSLKGNFDGIREVIQRIEERKEHQAETADLQRQILQSQ